MRLATNLVVYRDVQKILDGFFASDYKYRGGILAKIIKLVSNS